MSRLYMAVTADEYELPRYIADTRKEMAEYLGTTSKSLGKAICYGSVRRNEPLKGCRIIRVEVDDEQT